VTHPARAIKPLRGAGLGFRKELIPALKKRVPSVINFFEVAPENWIDVGGAFGKDLCFFSERFPFVCHGLSLSLGGPAPLDELLLRRIKTFLIRHDVPLYTEHLSYCSDDGYLYDLLPIPFTEEAVRYVAERIRVAQDILERKIAVENASFYVAPAINEMSELEFIRAVLEESDCLLHLDVNNVYVNSVNHRYDPFAFIQQLPRQRIAYMHVAGHYVEAPDLIVDTHAAAVIDPVWSLLDFSYELFGVKPTLLERDFNIPPLPALTKEVSHIARLQAKWARHAQSA
jgi:uncharacterized protein (UPF0276 family)